MSVRSCENPPQKLWRIFCGSNEQTMEITYLLNSGFMVRHDRVVLVFDDYADPSEIVDKVIADGDFTRLYFFVSHAHFDHFDSHILAYAPHVTSYIMSREIRRTKRGKLFPPERTVFLSNYAEWSDEEISVRTFSSTDVGTSFLVSVKGRSIFHAGDFNWWHWSEDSAENIAAAKENFMAQMKKLDGIAVDVVFFPIDGRLGKAQEWGAGEFCRRTKLRLLVAMHNVGFPRWQPSADFFVGAATAPHWSPTEPGESLSVFD